MRTGKQSLVLLRAMTGPIVLCGFGNAATAAPSRGPLSFNRGVSTYWKSAVGPRFPARPGSQVNTTVFPLPLKWHIMNIPLFTVKSYIIQALWELSAQALPATGRRFVHSKGTIGSLSEHMSNAYRRALTELVRGCLARFARLLLWEPVESLQSFVEVLTPCIVNKIEPELANAVRKDRIDDLEKRAFRWLERSFWQDISNYPDDPLDNRTVRLENLFNNVPKIPLRQGDGEHFPISVFVEYDSILKLFEPIFTRRPAKVSHLSGKEAKRFAVGTRQGERGLGRYRSNALTTLNMQRFQLWKAELLQLANRVIPIAFWPKGQEAWFTEDEIIELTAQTAALRVLGRKLGLGNDAVVKLVKDGKKMLPPRVLQKMEIAYTAVENNDSWQFLNRLYPPK